MKLFYEWGVKRAMLVKGCMPNSIKIGRWAPTSAGL